MLFFSFCVLNLTHSLTLSLSHTINMLHAHTLSLSHTIKLHSLSLIHPPTFTPSLSLTYIHPFAPTHLHSPSLSLTHSPTFIYPPLSHTHTHHLHSPPHTHAHSVTCHTEPPLCTLCHTMDGCRTQAGYNGNHHNNTYRVSRDLQFVIGFNSVLFCTSTCQIQYFSAPALVKFSTFLHQYLSKSVLFCTSPIQ